MSLQTFNIAVFSEDSSELLHRLITLFSRRKLRLGGITVCETEMKKVFRYTFVVRENEDKIKRLIGQLEKQVEVISARYYKENEVVSQELALIKLAWNEESYLAIEQAIRHHSARILAVTKDFLVVEMTGTSTAIDDLHKALQSYNILEYSSSGPVAVTRPMGKLENLNMN